MHQNQQTITDFYAAFAALDPDKMAPCYAHDAVFEDEVFSLRGHEVSGMWRMLCQATQAKGRDAWKLVYSDIGANGANGRAHWEADYLFSATGRSVHNVVDARFTFDAEGRITAHRDRFNFWAWSRQALGMPGLLLGWTPMLRQKVRRQAAANLQKFLAHQGQ